MNNKWLFETELDDTEFYYQLIINVIMTDLKKT